MTEEQIRQSHPAGAGPGPRVVAGRYTLLGELGRGGMGVVWRGEDTVIGRPVAVKELAVPSGAEAPGVFQERVLREVRTGGRLNDPAVVTVYDVVTEGGTTFIVMELVEAPTLAELVRREGPLPPHRVAAIGEQVLSALRAAHEAGIVHRDVKPGNIMVAPGGRVKLTDFGIAQAVDDPRLTTSGMLVGSPAFMAPERVAGREALPASDLWALGATLFFAVEGVVAFERPTTAATLHAILHEVPYLTRTQGPLASAIMGLLVAAPEARLSAPQAGGLLAMAARQQGQSTPPGGQPATAAYAGQPTVPTGPGAPGPAAGEPRRRGRGALAAGAVLASVALLAGGFFLGRPVWSPATDEAMLPTLTYGDGGDVGFTLSSGADVCLNGRFDPGYQISSANQPDCDERHDFEVYLSEHALGAGAYASDDAQLLAYPGVERLRSFAETQCALGFHSDIVPAESRPSLTYRALVPSKALWEQPQESDSDLRRTVYCVLADRGGDQLTEQVTVEVK
ncbi:serine/threonine protein kinase [Prauserella shujinwangii]|uniref:non-specific serine/threonine protein kinase n=1 Tax=Prauserella shujinwangii TaxID=1453103 RepID=A0A2T0M2Y1_9PSEU|nr:serine/threonine-protein kinase [Prauserella shujinwangii]PRX51069.1 serine/threonine protein kinase [Prauserella shujinwangii]